MLKASTKEFLIKDLIDTKDLLIKHADDQDTLFIKSGAIDQLYISKALEFQKNAILYNSILTNIEELNSDVEKSNPLLEMVANDLKNLKSRIENQD